MTGKKNVISALILSFLLLAGCASYDAAEKGKAAETAALPEPEPQFKEGSEPEGFRGIKWGTDIKDLPGMEYSRIDPSSGGIEVYTRKDDALVIGDSKIEKIEYSFWNGKFSNVWIYTMGLRNWQKLKEAFFEAFGPGFQARIEKEDYLWLGEKTRIRIIYDVLSRQGTAVIISREQSRKMETGE